MLVERCLKLKSDMRKTPQKNDRYYKGKFSKCLEMHFGEYKSNHLETHLIIAKSEK